MSSRRMTCFYHVFASASRQTFLRLKHSSTFSIITTALQLLAFAFVYAAVAAFGPSAASACCLAALRSNGYSVLTAKMVAAKPGTKAPQKNAAADAAAEPSPCKKTRIAASLVAVGTEAEAEAEAESEFGFGKFRAKLLSFFKSESEFGFGFGNKVSRGTPLVLQIRIRTRIRIRK